MFGKVGRLSDTRKFLLLQILIFSLDSALLSNTRKFFKSARLESFTFKLLAVGNTCGQCRQAMSAGNVCGTHGYKINKIRLYALFHSDYGGHAGIQAVFLLPMPTNCLILSILRAGKWKSGLYTHERWQLGSGSGVRKNERNKPIEGKRVLCWTAIKKEKLVIKYIMGHRGK